MERKVGFFCFKDKSARLICALFALTLMLPQICLAGEEPEIQGQDAVQQQSEIQEVQEKTEAPNQADSQENREDPNAPDMSATLVAPIIPTYLPIIMYHQISRESSKLGAYVISDAEFEADMKLLHDNGYTTVTIKDLLAYVNKEGILPEKPVMLTFDDGFQSDYVYALPILKKYNMKAIFSIIGKYTDENSDEKTPRHVNYSHLSWDEIKEMQSSGLAEFQCHTYDMHDMSKRKGALRKWSESAEDYRQHVLEDLGKLSQACLEHIGVAPTAFTCPFGCYSDQLGEILKEFGFPAIMHSYQRMNILTGNPDELYILKRFLRTHNKDVSEWVAKWNELFKEPIEDVKKAEKKI
ncbi:MAG: polysaccharide deacetylase family protein [Clostridiales bacterium]|nr:polysaccharide deacetylase family protein [Clostridiales bacterium]